MISYDELNEIYELVAREQERNVDIARFMDENLLRAAYELGRQYAGLEGILERIEEMTEAEGAE